MGYSEWHKTVKRALCWAGLTGGVTLICYTISRYVHFYYSDYLEPYFLMMIGAMMGFALSFLIPQSVTFEQIFGTEKPLLAPWMRTLFICLGTIVLSWFLQAKLVSIQIGAVSSADIPKDPFSALLFGGVVGLSEPALRRLLQFGSAKAFRITTKQ